MKISFSLKTKIRLIFTFLFILLFLAILPFHHMQEIKAHENVVQYYERVMQHIREQNLPKEESIQYLENLNFTQIQAPQQIVNINRPIISRRDFEAFNLKDSYYLHIRTPHFQIILKDESNKFKRTYLDIYISLFVVLLFAFIYYLIIKNINDTQHQLKSRQLFLRTIMHELKTPIAKGRIVSELIDDEKQKNRIITIFEKLNHLIDDFAKVEQIVSNNYLLDLHSYKIDVIVQKSIDMLLLEQTSNIILQDISANKMKADLDLFSLAIKNLIDNALKYSNDIKVLIKEENNQLLFISNGKELQKPLHEYFKPFHNETKNKTHGMGLGLYIVHTILQMHNMQLKYEYKDKQNIFKIIMDKN
jgi:two-component system OmpR family sensor kinase